MPSVVVHSAELNCWIWVLALLGVLMVGMAGYGGDHGMAVTVPDFWPQADSADSRHQHSGAAW